MPFIELGEGFKDAHETETAPEDSYDLVCRSVEHITEGGKNNVRVTINFEGREDEYDPIWHYLALPLGAADLKRDEEKGHKPGTTAKTKGLMLKRFLHHFGVPYEDSGDQCGFDPNDIPGARARCPVVVDEWEGRLSNKLNYLPRLPDEPREKAA